MKLHIQYRHTQKFRSFSTSMESESIITVFINTIPSFTFTSEFENYQDLPNGQCKESQTVACFSSKWVIRFYPNGDTQERQGNVGVFLKHTGYPLHVQFRLTLQGKNADVTAKSVQYEHKFYNDGYGHRMLLPRQEFLENYTSGDKATVDCTITSLDNNWRVHELMTNIETQYAEKQWTDFNFIVAGTKFPVHRWILASCSSVFQTMMMSGMQESTAQEAVIADFSIEAVQCFLAVIYMNDKAYQEASIDVKLEALLMADKYDTKSVMSVISDDVSHLISNENCLTILETSERANCISLEDAAAKYIRAHNKEVWRENKIMLIEKYGPQCTKLMGYFTGEN